MLNGSRILRISIFIFFLATAFSHSQSVTSAISSSPLELVHDWRVLSVGVAIFSILIVALIYMLGRGFEQAELIAWSAHELSQVFATILIVLFFVAFFTFLDGALGQMINGANLGFTCAGTSDCAIAVSTHYLQGMLDLASTSTQNYLISYSEDAKVTSIHTGAFTSLFLYPVPLLEMQVNFAPDQGYNLDMDRYLMIFENMANIMSSITSQKFFVSEVAYKLGPVLLAIGIVARTFFATRKLGGLLIAIAVAIMYVFPLMYVFNWMSLNISVYGGSVISPASSTCPLSCSQSPPLFVSNLTNTTFNSANALLIYLESKNLSYGDRTAIIPLQNGSASSVNFVQDSRGSSSETIISCIYGSCPMECRELPLPGIAACSDNISACSQLDSRCKVIRLASASADSYTAPNSCPLGCRTVPPLQSNCNVSNDRYLIMENPGDIPPNPSADCTLVTLNHYTSDGSTLSSVEYHEQCNCLNSPDHCRVVQRGNLTGRPAGCDRPAYACPANENASNSCVWVMPNQTLLASHACDGCLFVPSDYTYSPPLEKSCAQLCTSTSGSRSISPTEFTTQSREGMSGTSDEQTVAALYLPAYILPLMNIVVTLIFIRTLSPILGGDMDIPGVAKII